MATWKLKSCPRCSGDTFIEKDVDGWVERCLLCGYSRELVEAEKTTIVTSGTKK
jgi:ribosomal protein S27AE